MRKPIASLLLLTGLTVVPALANSLTFRIGYFFPAGQSELWEIEFDQMSFSKSNYQSTAFGIDYELFLTKNFSLVAGFDTYQKNKAGYYEDYAGFNIPGVGIFAVPVDFPNDFDLLHAFNVSITPIQVGMKFTPLGRRTSLIPYISGGMTVFLWSVTMEGDMIDFSDAWIITDPWYGETEGYSILTGMLADERNKLSLGYHVAGGVQWVVGNKITLQAEVKYFSGKGALTEWFEGFDPFDLASLFISLGLNYWF